MDTHRVDIDIAELAGIVAESVAQSVTADDVAEVLEWCREWARDVEHGELFMVNDANLLHVADKLIVGGLAFVLADCQRVRIEANDAARPSRDAVAASLAAKAAESFTYDDDAEDADSAAQRAADILRDLSPGDVPAFALRVFGLPLVDRYVSADVDAHRRYVANDPGRAFPDDWQARVQAARAEKGYPQVASRLVLDHADIIVSTVFAEHRAEGSTNLSHWDEGIRCLAALNTLRAFTYGSGPLDSVAASRALESMELDAIGHAIEAVQYAADNARQGDSD